MESTSNSSSDLKPREITNQKVHIENLVRDGFTIVPEVLSADSTHNLLTRIKEIHLTGQILSDESGISPNQKADDYVYHLQFQDEIFTRLLGSWESGMGIIGHFLNDPNYRQLPIGHNNFLLAYYNARCSRSYLDIHMDNYVPSSGYYPNSMQLIFSLNGQTASNGGSFAIPGSHRSVVYPTPPYNDIKDLDCNPGDAIIWDSRIWHGAHENQSRLDRWSVIATFRPWWAKQNFDVARGMPQHIFGELKDTEKALLGFLSIPPKDQSERLNLKQGLDKLLPAVIDYS